MMVQLFESMRYKPKGCGFDFQWGHWNFPLIYLSGCTVTLGLTQPLTEMSTKSIFWGVKVAGA
jgi:hypothetical protein